MGNPLQKYNKASRLNHNKMADLLFCFKKHLWNYQAKFNETIQEASLHISLKKYNMASRLTKNKNNKMADFGFSFNEHLLLKTSLIHMYYCAKFNETSQEASLGDPLQK